MKSIMTLLCIIFLTACSGGGDSDGPPADFPLLDPSDNDTETENTTELSFQLVSEEGLQLQSIDIFTRVKLLIQLKNDDDDAIENILLNISSDNIDFEPSQVLTNNNGLAEFVFTAGSDSTIGTATIQISDNSDFSEEIYITVQQAKLQIGHFEDEQFINGVLGLDSNDLVQNQSTLISLAVTDAEGQPIETPISIQLSSPCSMTQPALANLPSTTTTSNGLAFVSYTPNGCAGTDTILAQMEPVSDATAQVTVNFVDFSEHELSFVSLSNENISFQGTGISGQTDSSEAVFKVLDSSGNSSQNVEVHFSLTNSQGGAQLEFASRATNSQGLVSARVFAGTQPSETKVLATIPTDNISALSASITISSGMPDQNSITIFADKLNIPGGDAEGFSSQITVRLSDHLNTPVPDGTAAFFSAEYGSIDASCATKDGQCQVTWTAQEPRLPLFNSGLMPTIKNSRCSSYNNFGPCPARLSKFQGGRSTILVTITGEESFIDGNGNGQYDNNELFEDLPEAFIDHNEDGLFNPATDNCNPDSSPNCASGAEETFIDVDQSGDYSTGNGIYNGTLCPNDGTNCSRDLITARKDITIVASNHTQYISVIDVTRRKLSDATVLVPGLYTLYIADIFNNPPAAGSTIFLTSEKCNIESGIEFDIPNTNTAGAYSIDLTLGETEESTEGIDSTESTEGEIIVTVIYPDDITQEFIYACVDQKNEVAETEN